MSSGCTPFAPRIPCLITTPSIALVASRNRIVKDGPVRKFTGRYDRRRGSEVRGITRSLTSASREAEITTLGRGMRNGKMTIMSDGGGSVSYDPRMPTYPRRRISSPRRTAEKKDRQRQD
jgi:hypothetical protein